MIKVICAVALALTVAACTKEQPQPNADAATLERVRFSDTSDPSLTLYTMVSNSTGRGAHSSLMINASERVIFDPAGSFYAPTVPERDDVLYGISPQVEKAYRGAHARETFHVVRKKISVTPEQAETAYRMALSYGPVPDAYCANATSGILSKVPGFSAIRTTMYPTKLMSQFGELPGVVTSDYYEDDSADLQDGLRRSQQALAAE